MKILTQKEHAARLIRMLEACNKNLRTKCPNAPWFDSSRPPEEDNACEVCTAFVGLTNDDWCPCLALGCKEAVKRSWLALEAKGYLKGGKQ